MEEKGYSVLRMEDANLLEDDDYQVKRGGKRKHASLVKGLLFHLFVLLSVGTNVFLLVRVGQYSDIGKSRFSESSQPSWGEVLM